jgi:hypothetical protein
MTGGFRLESVVGLRMEWVAEFTGIRNRVAMYDQLTGIVVCRCAHVWMVAGHGQCAMHLVSEIRGINSARASGSNMIFTYRVRR